MAEASGIRAGRAFVELALKGNISAELQAQLNKVAKVGDAIASIGKRAALLGGLVTAPLIAAAKASAESGAAIYEMSRRTGLSAEALSTLSYAADRTGADLGTVE